MVDLAENPLVRYLKLAIEYTLHPLLLLGSVFIWYRTEDNGFALLIALLGSHIVLRICENVSPRHPRWKQSPKEIVTIVGITLVALILAPLINLIFENTLSTFLVNLRESLGVDLWPKHWPHLAQLFLMYFLSEFIFYWIHRGIHNSTVLWKLSGHGFHHSFKNLHAINFVTTHPFELFFLAIPSLLLGSLVGAPSEVITGGIIVLLVNASFAHSNVKTSSQWMGLIFTNNAQHVRHHSAVLEESNTNYSCNAIVLDRLFGTYSEGPIDHTGIGPSEPSLLEKLLLPIREPHDIKTAPRLKPQSTG